ncbi:MAG: glycosyltransferase [Phycisphaeraceae bacterium]
MNIVMLTNTFLPHVGGVARSVASFTDAFRQRGHRVLVVAPTFRGTSVGRDSDVLRVPAIQRFNGSDFSVRLPSLGLVSAAVAKFSPDVIHAHHPFLLGDTALRLATSRNLPLVFTQHTMYERYTHYVPGDSEPMRRFAIRLATEYANLCDHIIAPSRSIAKTIRERGVQAPVSVVPTGIDPAGFARGDGQAARERWGVPKDAFVVGHVGRLAAEKNLPFLVRAVGHFLQACPGAHLAIVGAGPAEGEIRQIAGTRGLADRVHLTGSLNGQALADAYHAMDVFAFASQTETQGMVLAEAMTAGVPVVAVDAPGVREVVRDGENGRLLMSEDEQAFAEAVAEIRESGEAGRKAMRAAALATADAFSLDRCAERALKVYDDARQHPRRPRAVEDTAWTQTLRLLEGEWNLWTGRAEAAMRSLREGL